MSFPRLFPGYRKLSYDEDEEDLADSAFKKQHPDSGRRQSATTTAPWRPSLPVLLLGGLAFTIGLALVALFFNRSTPRQFSPTLESKAVLFEAHPIYAQESSAESDAAWDALLPTGRGFVLVEDPEAYHLKAGIPTEVGVERYGVSMFHQLHCLGMMREAYYSAVQGRNSTIFAEASLTEKQRQSSRRQHIGHCFDYIRQAIMCGGDMTLEWAKEPDPGRERETVDGWGITHQCRNFDQGLDWVKKHKAPFDHDGIA